MRIEPVPTSSENAELDQGSMLGGSVAPLNTAADLPVTTMQNAPDNDNESLPAVWREELPGLLLAWLGGGLIGGLFLMFAVLSRPMTALPVTVTLVVGGALLAIGPGIWVTVDAWLDWRSVRKLESGTAAPPQAL